MTSLNDPNLQAMSLHARDILKNADDRNSLMMNSIHDAVILTDLEGVVVFWNRGAERQFGWKSEEMVGRYLAYRYPEPIRSWTFEEIKKRAAGEPWSGEYEDLHKNGSRVWIDAEVRRIEDPSGQPIGILGVSRDISERKKAQLTLLGQNRVLHKMATNAPILEILQEIVHFVENQIPETQCSILTLSADGTRLRLGAAQSLPKDYNAAVDGLRIGPNVGSCGTAAYFKHPVIVEDIANDPLWSTFREFALSFQLRSCWSFPIFASDSSNTLLGTFALYRDRVSRPEPRVTEVIGIATQMAGVAIERERSRRHLQESEESYRLLVENVPDYAVFMTGPDGIILTWNQGAELIYQISKSDAIGRPVASLFASNNAISHAHSRLEEVLAEGHAEFEDWHLRSNGVHFLADIVATALHYSDSPIRGFSFLVRDLTERKQMEEQLRQSQKMEAVGQLAGGIAHDFNNLLTIINGFTEILLSEIPPESTQHDSLQAIREAGLRAASLTGQLLAFSRKAIVEPKVLLLNSVVDSTASMLRRLLGEQIRLSTRLNATQSVRMDRGQLEQLIMNLAVNARDAMPQGGQLTLETEDVTFSEEAGTTRFGNLSGSYVILNVRDTGIGMTREVQNKIFEPFFTTKGVGRGTGLGLATVYGIVQQANGHIAVESELGKGTLFRVYFPAMRDTPRPVLASPPSIIETIQATVLLVEDEPEVRRLARISLESSGYRTLEASSGEEAMSMAKNYPGEIHLLITDVVMPGIGGRILADMILKDRPELKVLYISGYTDDAIVLHGIQAETDMLLMKPFTPRELTRKVRQMLRV